MMIIRKAMLIFSLLFVALCASAQQNNDELLAAQYYQTGDFEKAMALYQKLFSKTQNPNYYDPYLSCLLKLKKFDDAERLTKKLLKENPGDATYSIDIGRIYQERGQVEKANDWYANLINNLPKNEAAIRDYATSFYRTEAYDYAIKAFTTGRKILNNESAFTFDLISLYRYRKDKVMLIQEYLTALETSVEVLNQAENSLMSIFEDNDDYDMLKTALLRKIQRYPQNLSFTELLTWRFLQQKDFDSALRQTIALDRRLKEDGERVYELSALLQENKAYNTSIEALNYLIGKGVTSRFYVPAKINLLNARYKLVVSGKYQASDLLILEKAYKELLTEYGENINTAFAIRQLANLQAFYLKKPAEAEVLLEHLLEFPNLPLPVLGQTKLDLGDIYILTGEVWEAALIYGQLEKQFANEPFGQEAKFRNARLSYYQGDLTWAKAQLDVLKGSTSQLIANDALNLSLLISENLQNESDSAALKLYAIADLRIFKNQSDLALAKLDSIAKLYPSNSLSDDILMAKAKIFLAKNDFKASMQQLQNIVDNYSTDLWADDAVFMMADIYETKLNDPEKAKLLYQKLIIDFPGSLYIIEARKHFRNLRGDKVGS